MKKILAAALLCTVSAFATWDYFPIKEAGKGEAKLGLGFDKIGDFSGLGLNAKARFSVIEGLEAALFLNVPLALDYDAGLSQPAIGLRYWLPFGLGIFADVTLPFHSFDGAAPLGIYPGIQYSTEFTSELSLGTELGVVIPFENSDTKFKPGMDLKFGFELDYAIGSITPFIGSDFLFGLTKPQVDGNDFGDAAKLGINPFLGVIYGISETLAADAGVSFGLGDRYPGDTPIWITANVSLSF